jgi:hypothetical protein
MTASRSWAGTPAILCSNFKLICLSSPGCKNIPLRGYPKSPLELPPSRPREEGRWPSSRTLGRVAVDAAASGARGARRAVIRERAPRADERRLNAFAMASVGRHSVGWSFWRRKLRTAKPCGPGTRGWCQSGGGLQSSTGRCEPSIRQGWRQEEFVSRESAA